jgi:primosomal protein N' (replication factor Y)
VKVVAEIRPLRLKRQIAQKPDGPVAQLDSIAHVWVDNAVPHLDSAFDYLVPESLSDQITQGVRVLVPFAGRNIEGLVLSRSDDSAVSGLKSILSVLSPLVVADQEALDLIQATCDRWAGHPYDVIRSAIPPRVASVEKDFIGKSFKLKAHQSIKSDLKCLRHYRLFSPGEDPLRSLADLLVEKSHIGGVLLIVPEERELDRLENILKEDFPTLEYVRLDASMERSVRYRNYLLASHGERNIVIGARSAIFAPVDNLQTIMVYREGAQSHYELRSPGWNVRDVAILRSIKRGASLLFAGFSPSSEAARLIESGWLTLVGKPHRINIQSASSPDGELLPSQIFTVIRAALIKGPVLFLVPRKGYSSALLCKKCRNIALCACGGKLTKKSLHGPPQCSHCAAVFQGWRCPWCQSEVSYLLGRGTDRYAEEIGRAFPGQRVATSAGEHILESVPGEPLIVIATPGAQPRAIGGYAAVILLEGAVFFGEVDMRAQERARESFFYSASLLAPDAKVIAVIDDAHPITASIARWNPSIMARRELADRLEAQLPPYFRSATIELPEVQSSSVVTALKSALSNRRLPSSTRILGPASIGKGVSRILLTSSLEDGPLLVELLHEFMRKRSIAKKDSLTVRVDPYSLS